MLDYKGRIDKEVNRLTDQQQKELMITLERRNTFFGKNDTLLNMDLFEENKSSTRVGEVDNSLTELIVEGICEGLTRILHGMGFFKYL